MHKLLLVTCASLAITACSERQPTAKDRQAQTGTRLAEDVIKRSGGKNAEQENIAKRLSLTMNPGQIGFVALFNQAGAPIAYYGVKGKITSSGKRLTPSDEPHCSSNGCYNRLAPSDEGSYGSSDPYVYFWTVDGQYIQWNGPYLYSDKPFRLRVEPLVISIEGGSQ